MSCKPNTNKKLMVQRLSSNFREAVSIEDSDMCHPKKGEICVKNKYVGINATDVNITKGRYFTDGKIPYTIGFEGIGDIVEVGDDVSTFEVGQTVMYLSSNMNAYAEFSCMSATDAFHIPDAKPDFLPLLASGLTATLGLDKSARIKHGETVLVTAAAGGAGHLAVQWAKAAGCHVIGTCSSKEKETLLKELGCDRVINYKKDNLGNILLKEYPNGIDVIWETIGGEVFETCLKNLAIKGRLIIIGAISAYTSNVEDAFATKVDLSSLPSKLLLKSASVCGFLVLHYGDCYATYVKLMCDAMTDGKLRPIVDSGASTGREFVGMDGIIRGVEHLHSGKSIGKVIARIY